MSFQKSSLECAYFCARDPIDTIRGQVFVDGVNVGRLSKRQVPAHRRQIGIVFQDNKLLADRSAFDNVALPLVIAGVSDREIPRRVRAALALAMG